MRSGSTVRATALSALLLLLVFAGTANPWQNDLAAAKGVRFRLVLDGSLQSTPFSGYVYVLLAAPNAEPRNSRSWTDPPPVFSRFVEDWTPGDPLVFDSTNCVSYPSSLAELEGRYSIQAVARRNLDSPKPGLGEGDLFSEVRIEELDPAIGGVFDLKIAREVVESPFNGGDRVEVVELTSEKLSRFHGRDVVMKAGVRLPKGWSKEAVEKGARYPVVVMVTGFGGSYRFVRIAPFMMRAKGLDEVVLIVPDARCFRGHCVFADSENNGPWGAALVEELLPFLEKRFGGAGKDHRYVTGVSSGGWSSLWLQVTYPDEFAGCWAIAPDPVDFRDFQRIDLYADNANMYRTRAGERRPLARREGRVIVYYEDFVAMEEAMGPGGQIHSFEAVFSPRDDRGSPALLFDRASGAVDPKVVRAWERYDIGLILKRNWKTLGPKLKGKLVVHAGEEDSFYLEGAVRLLKQSLADLGSDAEVKVFPGVGHGPAPGVFRSMIETVLARFKKGT